VWFPGNRLTAIIKKFPLRTVLIVPFVLQIVGTAGLVGYLSYTNGQKAVNNLADQLAAQIGDRVVHYLDTYLSAPHLINRINADAVRQKTINLQDLPQLERYLFFNSNSSIHRQPLFLVANGETSLEAIALSDIFSHSPYFPTPAGC